MNLLTNSIENEKIDLIYPKKRLIFPLTRYSLAHPRSSVLHIDWAHDQYITEGYTRWSKIDTLITYIRSVLFYIDLILVRALGNNIIWTVHNKHNHENKCLKLDIFNRIILAKMSDQIIVKCTKALDTIVNLYNVDSDKVEIISDGNYIPAYQNNISRTDARSTLGISEDKFIYLFFGLVRPYKGVSELIDSFSELEFEDAELWIVGNPINDDIQAIIYEKVKCEKNINLDLRYIPNDEIQYFMNSADVLVLPYRKILNSGTVHLGMSYGLPIIAPKIGCIPETISERNDLLYDPEFIDNLEAALIEAYTQPNLEKMGKENYQVSVSNNWKKVGEKYAETFVS